MDPLVVSCALLGHDQLSLRLEPYPLSLRSAFGTAHSSSMQRTNGLLTMEFSRPATPSATDDASASPQPQPQPLPPVSLCVRGVGEAGMPAKKTGCYELTYDALREHVQEWSDRINEEAKGKDTAAATAEASSDAAAASRPPLYDPFAACPAPFYSALRADLSSCRVCHPLLPSLLFAFRVLDSYVGSKLPAATDAAFLCVAEAALMDAWGRMRQQPLCNMIGVEFDGDDKAAAEAEANAGDSAAATSAATAAPAAAASAASSSSSSSGSLFPPHRQPRSFYTVGLDSFESMLRTLHFGLDYTPLIKIKCDADVARTAAFLDEAVRVMSADPRSKEHMQISIDANSSWATPELALEFLAILRPHAAVIAMVEQPFPLFRACPAYIDAQASEQGQAMKVVEGEYVTLSSSELAAWEEVAGAYAAAGLPIYADESICGPADLRALRPILHGVNIKLEKAGGYRGALRLMHEARQSGAALWLGCMVGSSPNATQAAHLLPLATPDCWGDLDGNLLTTEESDRFRGGMRWKRDGTGAIGMTTADDMGLGMHALGGTGVVEKESGTNKDQKDGQKKLN